MRKRAPARSGRRGAELREDVCEAIDRVWPDGIIEMCSDPDDSYFSGLHPKLSSALRRIRNTHLLSEREAKGGLVWWDGSDPEDPPDETELERSYHTFFVSPEGKDFTFEPELEDIIEPEFMSDESGEADWGEDPPISRIPGTGRTGWVVAVSLLAPFAVIELGNTATFEDGSAMEAEIESYAQTAEGERVDPEEDFRAFHSAQAYKILASLRARIAGILERFGIAVLPAEEWRNPAPWLRGTAETLIGLGGKPIRVLDAFFFQSL